MKTNEILKEIRGNGGFCNIGSWTKKDIAVWVKSNYGCSDYIARKVAMCL